VFPVFNIALSGMQAAELRAQAAAENIANSSTVGSLPDAVGARQSRQAYQPVSVVQSSNVDGGVSAELVNKEPAYIEEYNPGSPFADARGVVAAPNVDLAEEAANLMSAKLQFAANAMVMRAASEMARDLFDALDHDHDNHRRRLLTI
jgi:flagellar basal-body rod protein FlgC